MKEIRNLLHRVIGDKAEQIETEFIQSADGKNCFEIDGVEKVIIRGDNGVSIANGFYNYLKKYCDVHISWCGEQMSLPDTLPIPKRKTRHIIEQTYRAMYNYCSFGYSMAFWDFKRWEKELDFLALNGINMPLSIVGTEAVWYYSLLKVGFSNDEALSFLSSPAYYPWQAMTNFEGVMPPKSESYIKRRLELGKKIINRQTALGMQPVQQGFSGFVPRAFIKKFPNAKITMTKKWAKFPKTAQLDPLDPLFKQFGTVFLKTQKELLGDFGFYAADPFHESKPTVKGKDYLNNVGLAIDSLFREFNPNSVWVIQSWSLRKDIVTAVPKDRLIIFDLNGEVCKRDDYFWGYDFVLGRLDNFGQKTYYHGNIKRTAENEFGKLSKTYPNLKGTGIFPEGTLSNPMYYEALFEAQTVFEPLKKDEWIRDYCKRRYGRETENAVKANEILFDKVYVQPLYESGYSSVICALPMFNIKSSGQCDYIEKPYDADYITDALSLMLKDKKLLKDNECYRYDIADLTRQFASNTAITLHKKIVHSYKKRDKKAYYRYKKDFLDLLELLDKALQEFDEMSFYKWLKSAESLAENELEKQWLTESARALLTIWGPYKDSEIYDYAWREWSGLIKNFYIPRWNIFFDAIEKKGGRKMLFIEKLLPRTAGKIRMRATPFYSKIADWTIDWIESPFSFVEPITANSLVVCEEIYERYKNA